MASDVANCHTASRDLVRRSLAAKGLVMTSTTEESHNTQPIRELPLDECV